MKLFRENPETPEGKYPIVLRRDGSLLESRNFVMVLKDPCAGAAIRAYAEKAHQLGLDEGYVESLERLADEADRLAFEDAALVKPTSDPDAPKHREDDPVILAWARSIGCPAT